MLLQQVVETGNGLLAHLLLLTRSHRVSGPPPDPIEAKAALLLALEQAHKVVVAHTRLHEPDTLQALFHAKLLEGLTPDEILDDRRFFEPTESALRTLLKNRIHKHVRQYAHALQRVIREQEQELKPEDRMVLRNFLERLHLCLVRSGSSQPLGSVAKKPGRMRGQDQDVARNFRLPIERGSGGGSAASQGKEAKRFALL